MFKPTKEQRRIYNATHKARHPERIKAANKLYYEKNKERISIDACFHNMVHRCENPKNPQFNDYGKRGITICERWKGSEGKKNFVMDMGKRPAGYSLERIDNEQNYSPSNCKWATRKEQQRNRRNSIFVEYEGKRIPLAEAAELTGIRYFTLNHRHKLGERGERLFRPTRPLNRVKRTNKKNLQKEELPNWEHQHQHRQTHTKSRMPKLNQMLQLLGLMRS